MEDRIATKKLNFVHHIANLSENSLGREFYETQTQRMMDFPGLVSEVKQLAKTLTIPDITDDNVASEWSKQRWKSAVKNAVKIKSENVLQQKIRGYKKLSDGPIASEKFELKDYMKQSSLADARIMFKMRSKMLGVKFNYKNDKKNRDDLWMCSSCQSGYIESQNHILWCSAYADLRADKDIT